MCERRRVLESSHISTYQRQGHWAPSKKKVSLEFIFPQNGFAKSIILVLTDELSLQHHSRSDASNALSTVSQGLYLLQEEAWCVRQEPCASLTPTTWTASYRERGQGEGLHFDHEQEAFRWSPSYTRWGGNGARVRHTSVNVAIGNLHVASFFLFFFCRMCVRRWGVTPA